MACLFGVLMVSGLTIKTAGICAHVPGLEQQIPLPVEQAAAHHGGGLPQIVLPDHGPTHLARSSFRCRRDVP